MSEEADRDSKTEEPTEKRLADTREKGNLAVSREAPIFASLVGMLVVGTIVLHDTVVKFSEGMRRFIDNPGAWPLENERDVLNLLVTVGGDMAKIILPCTAVLALAGLLSSLSQNMPQLILHRIKPDFSKLSLAKGWTRIFGVQGQVEFAKSLFKFATISVVVTILLSNEKMAVMNAMFMDPQALPELILRLSIQLLAAVSAATIVLVAADLVWARFSWRRNLRMTKQEIKDEHKQSDGDPQMKGKRMSIARERTRIRMMADVPKATVVIANPTHFAIAIRYERDGSGAPVVLAKGKDLIALKIREIAHRSHVPVVEDKPLARAMYDAVEVNQMIPQQFYKAVAQVIHFIYSQDNEAG